MNRQYGSQCNHETQTTIDDSFPSFHTVHLYMWACVAGDMMQFQGQQNTHTQYIVTVLFTQLVTCTCCLVQQDFGIRNKSGERGPCFYWRWPKTLWTTAGGGWRRHESTPNVYPSSGSALAHCKQHGNIFLIRRNKRKISFYFVIFQTM